MSDSIPGWKEALREMAFESRTKAGKAFDIILLLLIIISLVVVMLDSVISIHAKYGDVLHDIEWAITILFTIEYLIRLIAAPSRKKFVFSFLGIIDFIAIIPTYITLFTTGAQTLLMLRVLRLLRIFRIFRLSHFLSDIHFLSIALYKSLRRISVFMIFAIVLVILLGSLMYVVEKPENGFTSIPECIYWAVVTITTVGYGDLVPMTAGGKVLAGMVMLTGYAIIAIPMGIITNEIAVAIRDREELMGKACKSCKRKGHDKDALFCKYCGDDFNSYKA
jgi:voltage-gated potassium channel